MQKHEGHKGTLKNSTLCPSCLCGHDSVITWLLRALCVRYSLANLHGQCLLGLGSNFGDREATLRARSRRSMRCPTCSCASRASGIARGRSAGRRGRANSRTAPSLIDTTIAPLILLEELQQIEERHGRKPAERWAPRPIDIDMLLYDREVMEQDDAHAAASADDVSALRAAAGRRGRPEDAAPGHRLADRAIAAASRPRERPGGDCVAVGNAPPRAGRDRLPGKFAAKPAAQPELGTAAPALADRVDDVACIESADDSERPAAPRRPRLPYAAATFPKLTILLDGDPATPRAVQSKWSSIVRQPGRGPTLRLPTADAANCASRGARRRSSPVWPI